MTSYNLAGDAKESSVVHLLTSGCAVLLWIPQLGLHWVMLVGFITTWKWYNCWWI